MGGEGCTEKPKQSHQMLLKSMKRRFWEDGRSEVVAIGWGGKKKKAIRITEWQMKEGGPRSMILW